MALPQRVTAADVKQIHGNARGFPFVGNYLQTLQGKRDVPAALVFAASQLQDEQLMFYLAIGAYKRKSSRESMLWIQKTYVGVGRRLERRANIPNSVSAPLFETVTTASMLRRPGGYDPRVFDDAEKATSLLLADINGRYDAVLQGRSSGPYSVPSLNRATIEQELRDMQRLQLIIM
jgi:hypothetical protein